jgi:hypothetical protein
MLWRLSYPGRYKQFMDHFGRSRAWLSSVFNDTITHLVLRYRDKLFWDPHRLTLQTLQRYAHATQEAGGVSRVWGWIDGTIRPICRPSTVEQRPYWSGYKKTHGFKYQGILTSDGILSSLAGPEEGSVGDWKMWKECGLEERLRTLFHQIPEEQRLYIYGDPAYSGGFGIIGAYKASVNRALTDDEKHFNKRMSQLRIAVEHAFGITQQQWMYNGFKYGLRLGASPVAGYYLVSTLLTNCLTCLRGSQITDLFNLEPPTLEMYLN